jgi:hypothetical protein
LIEEAVDLVASAEERGLSIRILGGVGIRLLLGPDFDQAFERQYRDIDAIVRRRDGRELERLLEERGWEPATAFNALNGSRRLLFHDPLSDAQVDVFVEAFEMCHKLPLADRLDEEGPAVCATDLLMTKLQIVELNEKDRRDLYALLRGSSLATSGARSLDPQRIAELTSKDWGLHHTFELNLGRLSDGLDSGAVPAEDTAAISTAIDAIAQAMEDTPKSRGWSMRARIGERKRWYDEPEEVDRD